MCYMILAGKKATADGSMLCAHNNDLQGHHASLFEFLPAQTHSKGSVIEVSESLKIPHVERTYACSILKVWRGFMEGDAVAINEYQVAVAGGVDLGFDRSANAEALDPLRADGISGATRYIALQRSRTARECVEEIGRIYNEYGISYTCGVGVVDTKEAWYIEAGGGSCWVAVRVPDDCYMPQANGYRIATFDPNDAENVICSPGLAELLERKGQKNPDGAPNFARTFGGKMREQKGTAYLNSRRVWGAIRRFSPSLHCDPSAHEFPLFLRPEKKLTVSSLMEALSDRFEGTEYDAFPQGGGTGKDRPICVPSCVHSDVIQLRGDLPADVGAVMWAVLGTPYTSPYIPLHFGVKDVPSAYLTASPRFDAASAFWHFRALSDLILVDFPRLFPPVREAWKEMEEEALSLQSSVEEAALKLYSHNPELARKVLWLYADSFARRALERTSDLEALLHTEIAEGMHQLFSHPGLSW